MSPKIPILTSKQLVRALKAAGFTEDRQKGLLKKIIRGTGLTVEEFINLL